MFRVLSDPAIYVYENEPPPSPQWLHERYARLESRRSPDDTQQWLNWVIRMPDGQPAGYVQATVFAEGHALVAYVLGSAFWGRGIASRAVAAMIEKLRGDYDVRDCLAMLKAANHRSLRLLQRLGFSRADGDKRIAVDADELLMILPATTSPSTR